MTNRAVTFDFETTTHNSGNPFDERNFAVCLAYQVNKSPPECEYFEDYAELPHTYDAYPTVPEASLYVLFNAKFDLHWYRKYTGKVPAPVWDCQLAEFYLSGFKNRFPSLDETAERYGLGKKIDTIKLEYWDKGIGTEFIPRDVLTPYAKLDVSLTYLIYLTQLELFQSNPKLLKSFRIACEDLLVLQEMEWNGLKFDKELCTQRANEISKELQQIDAQLSSVYPDVPINFGSGDQLSAFLYGGSIKEERRVQIGVYKTGAKQGEPRCRVEIIEHQLPQLCKPLPRSELAKPGVFATDDGTLRKLKGPAARKYVTLLLKHAELSKLLGTYYNGIPKLNETMHWPENTLHGQFNQCIAATSRLSSSKPNLQNFSGDCEDIFYSRYN